MPEPSQTLCLERLGALFGYPGPDFSDLVGTCRLACASGAKEAAARVERFDEATRGLELAELEELYTATFDLDPISALEVGWHLYGESYERGRFLVRMRELLQGLGIDEAGELPDHLTSVLPALARLGPEEREELGRGYVLPAVARMLAGFEGEDNPYAHLIHAVDRTLRAIVGAPDEEPRAPGRTVPHHRRRTP